MNGRRRRIGGLVTAVVLASGLGVVQAGRVHASGAPTVIDYATPGSFPFGTAFDGTGRAWVALPGCDAPATCSSSSPPGKLALFDPSTQTWPTTVSLPAGYGQPVFVALDPSGKVWFTMPVTNTLGVYDPGSGALSQWTIPTPNGGPWGLTIDHNGRLWFTEHFGNKVGSFDPVSHAFTELATAAGNSNPYGITVDAGNNVWFTENNEAVARIGEVTAGGALNEYGIRNTATAGTGLTPHQITVDPFGNVWWSEGFAAAVGKLDVANAQPGTNNGVTEFPYNAPCCGAHTSGIAADGQGLIWLDDSLRATFGSLPIGGGNFTFYSSPKSHPHDGLNVDARGRVWFDEEMGNALAEVIPNDAPPAATQVGSGVVMDGFGGLHPFSVGGAPAPAPPFVQAPYWPGWDIARGVALVPNGSGRPSSGGYVLDGFGGLHPFGMEGNVPPSDTISGPYWLNWDIARGVALLPGAQPRGGFIVDAWGALHWFSIGPATPAPAVTESPGTFNPNAALARGAFILPDGSGGYVVDAFGGMHAFALSGAPMPHATIGGGASWAGWDIARGASLAASTNGLVLDGLGGLHAFWFGTAAVAAPAITGAPYWPGWAIARAIGM